MISPAMLAPVAKRKRARKACIPCHQRKRKCDAEYPCSTCTTYDYSCHYDEDSGTGGLHAPPSAKRGSPDGGSSIASRPAGSSNSPDSWAPLARGTGGTGASTTSPTVAANTSAGIFDERKSRYAGASAAMAFPHILGLSLGSDSTPKMPSFAYNFGIRPEEASKTHGLLDKFITEEDVAFYSDVYFSVMGPIGDLMDPRIYAQRCRDYYHQFDGKAIAFGAIAAGVVALGSYLSPNKHPRESDLVQYAKDILEDPASMRVLSIDQIIAWAMRVFYLRATTRPNNAWVASCTAMHLCEAVGLHKEENIKKMASIAGAAVLGHDADRLRRIFWIAWSGHNLLCFEYDRSSVNFGTVTCQPIIPIAGSVADQFVKIAQVIPAPNSPFRLDVQPASLKEELCERIKALEKLPFTHPFLVATKADVAFGFYRRLYQLNDGIPDEIIRLLIDHGNATVEAAEQLASQGYLFWNAIGSVFQYACIMLAIDTPAAHAQVGNAFRGLENLVKTADTELTRRALAMARHLLSLTMEKKRKELAQLEAVEASYQFHAQPESEATVPDLAWVEAWDPFLMDPYLSFLSPDNQPQG